MANLCCGLSKALGAVEHHMQQSFVPSSRWTLSLCDGMGSQCVDGLDIAAFLCQLLVVSTCCTHNKSRFAWQAIGCTHCSTGRVLTLGLSRTGWPVILFLGVDCR